MLQRRSMRTLAPLHQLEGLAKGLTIIVTGPTRSDLPPMRPLRNNYFVLDTLDYSRAAEVHRMELSIKVHSRLMPSELSLQYSISKTRRLVHELPDHQRS